MNIEPNRSVATSSRTRRTVVSVAIGITATIPIVTGSTGASDKPTAADTTESTVPTTTSPHETADSLEPNIDTSIVGDVVRLTFTLPDGWENNGWFVAKSNSDPIFGAIFDIVEDIYFDPCKWVPVSPQVGPSVDDLASAFANVPALNATAATDITVDGFHGKQVEFTVPDYTDDECIDVRYALYQNPGNAGQNPNYWAPRPPCPPSTVDPRHRRYPPRDRRHVLPGHLAARPRRPRHDPQLHPNRRPRRRRAVQQRRSGRHVHCVFNVIRMI
jgi:hypothetical protein